MPNWKKVITSGSDASLNSLNITTSLTASGLTYPTTDGLESQLIITDGDGTLSFGNARDVSIIVKNVSGGSLTKGTPVHATGTAGNASEVIAASASQASHMPATFILNEDLADEAEGEGLIVGFIQDISTTGFTQGDVLYVGPDGGYTNVKPTGSNLIQNIGIAVKIHGSNGSATVYGSGRSNDVPNLPTGKIWVGNNYTVTSSIVTLDEPNSQAQITGSLIVTNAVTASSANLSTLTITNSGSTDDSLLITTTEDSSTAAPIITLKRNSSSPDDGDYLGQLKFKGENDADQEVVYAKITAKTSDVTDTTEDGLLEFALKKAGSNNIGMRLTSTDLKLINGTNLEVDGGSISGSSLLGDGSGITNVVSSSYAVTASHALNAGGTDTVVVQYGHTSGNALGDSADYFIGMGTTMGNTGNSSIQIGIQAGTLVRADIATYNASTFGSSETSTVSVFSNNFAQENTISTSVLFDARHNLVSVTGLSISLLAGLSSIKLLTPTFTTNPANAKINITLYIEI